MIPKLFTPGPTPVPDSVRKAESEPMIHHRSEDFSKILEGIRHRLVELCGPNSENLVLSCSGTGGMEASIVSLFEEGDEVVVVEAGKFGERWVDLAQAYGLKANVIHVDWGRAVKVERVLEALTSETKGILIQACETSTGALHPVRELGKALANREDLLLVVDAITALAVHDLQTERDRIDVLIGGSQKAYMCPPGVATVSLSQRATNCVERKKGRGVYLSLQTELKTQRKNTTAFTPPVSLLRALHEALEIMAKEGFERIFDRHEKWAQVTREAITEMGLKLFTANGEAANGLTAVEFPPDLDGKAWLKSLKNDHGIWLAGGQAELSGRIFRIAHMGLSADEELLTVFQAMERTLADYLPAAQKGLGSKKAKEIASSWKAN